METKGLVLNLRGRFRNANSEDKSSRYKIPYLPSLKEIPKTDIQSKKSLKSTPKALKNNSPTTKSQFFSPYHIKSNSLNYNPSTIIEKGHSKKIDSESSVHQENRQKSKMLIENCIEIHGEMTEIHLINDEKNSYKKHGSGEESQEKPFGENQNFKAFDIEDVKKNYDDEKYQEDESSVTKNLKKENEELKKKLADLEQEYTTDTNLLKKNIEKEKQKNNMMIIELDKWTGKYDMLIRKHEASIENFNDKEKTYKTEIEELKNKLKLANEVINDKNLEIAQIDEYLENKRYDAKIKMSTLKDLNEKNKLLESEHSLRKEELITVKTTLKRTQTELENQKSKFATVESYIQSLNNKDTDCVSLEQALSEMKENYKFVSANYKELQIAYFNLKEKSYETEQNLLASIEKLKISAQNNIVNPINEPKLRRMNTFSSESNVENTTKDMMSRLLKKISTLEEQIVLYKNEIEKSNKDMAYHKKTIEEKCEMIAIMDKQITNKD